MAPEQVVDEILCHYERQGPDRGFACGEPLLLNTKESDSVMAVAHEYDRRGYSLFSCVRPWDAGVVQFVAEALGLGRPFVPSLYTADSATQFYEHAGVNVITTAPDSRAADHPAFGSRDALELHTDATLEAIGRVKSAMLFCMAPAADGGRTTLFRASAAFVEIARRERGLAAALLAEDGLVRHATVGRARRAHVGPVFAFQNGEVLSRYSATARDEWAFDSVPRLREATLHCHARARRQRRRRFHAERTEPPRARGESRVASRAARRPRGGARRGSILSSFDGVSPLLRRGL